MASTRYKKLNKRLTYAFSNVGRDIKSLRKESNEKFINREDYVKLFTAHTNLRKEHNELINTLKNELKEKLGEVNNRIKIQNKENNKINNHLAKLVEKERANRSEIKTVFKLKKELENLKENLNEFKEEYLKKLEYNQFNLKIERKLTEFNNKVDYMLKHSVDVDDVENNFITKSKVNKALDKIKTDLKKNSEKTQNNSETKIGLLMQEIDNINDNLKNLSNTVSKSIDNKDLKDATSKFVEQKIVDKELDKLRNEVESVNKDLSKIRSKKDITAEDFSRIESDIDKIKNNIILKKEVEKILESNSTKYQKIKEDIDWIEDKIKELAKEIDKNKVSVDFSKFVEAKEVINLKKQIETTNNNLSKSSIKEKDIERLTKQLDSLKRELTDKTSKKSVDKALETMATKIGNLRIEIDEIGLRKVKANEITNKVSKTLTRAFKKKPTEKKKTIKAKKPTKKKKLTKKK